MTSQIQTSLTELADAARQSKHDAERQINEIIKSATEKFKTQEEYQSKVIADASARFREVDDQLVQLLLDSVK